MKEKETQKSIKDAPYGGDRNANLAIAGMGAGALVLGIATANLPVGNANNHEAKPATTHEIKVETVKKTPSLDKPLVVNVEELHTEKSHPQKGVDAIEELRQSSLNNELAQEYDIASQLITKIAEGAPIDSVQAGHTSQVLELNNTEGRFDEIILVFQALEKEETTVFDDRSGMRLGIQEYLKMISTNYSAYIKRLSEDLRSEQAIQADRKAQEQAREAYLKNPPQLPENLGTGP